jgi:hypothetical protein
MSRCIRQQPPTALRLTCTCHDGSPRTFHLPATPRCRPLITVRIHCFHHFSASIHIHVPRTIQIFTVCFPQSAPAIDSDGPCPLVPCEGPVQRESQSQLIRKLQKPKQRRLLHGRCAQMHRRRNPRHMNDWGAQRRSRSPEDGQVPVSSLQKRMPLFIPHPLHPQ